MEPDGSNWTPCIVFGLAGDIRFGLPLKTGNSVVIPPKFKVEIGDFVDIKYKPIANDKPTDRARHIATEVRKPEQAAPKIKVKNNKVIFYTFAQVRGFDQFENKRVTLLYNDLFGHIIDLYQNLPLLDVGTIVEVECRMQESPRKKRTTIFIVTDHRITKVPCMQKPVQSSSNTTDKDSEISIGWGASDSKSSSIGQIYEQHGPHTLLAEETSTACSTEDSPKKVNKYANKSKTDMLFTVFNNDVMLQALKERDVNLWAHVANILATGEL